MSEPITAAAVIRFSEQLQEVSARFYHGLGATFPQGRQACEECVRRCQRDQTHLSRTYRETVTDALETNFSFEGLSLPQGLLEIFPPAGGDWGAALARAAQFEEESAAFYTEVATRAEGLLATIPQAYRRVAARRREQAEVWRALGAQA